jgi:hypothetical protein
MILDLGTHRTSTPIRGGMTLRRAIWHPIWRRCVKVGPQGLFGLVRPSERCGPSRVQHGLGHSPHCGSQGSSICRRWLRRIVSIIAPTPLQGGELSAKRRVRRFNAPAPTQFAWRRQPFGGCDLLSCFAYLRPQATFPLNHAH